MDGRGGGQRSAFVCVCVFLYVCRGRVARGAPEVMGCLKGH